MSLFGIRTLQLSDFQDIQTVDSKHLIAKYKNRRGQTKKYELTLIDIECCSDYLSKWKSLNHPGISRIKYLIISKKTRRCQRTYICTEYQEGENLENWLKENRDKFSKQYRSVIARKIVEALLYMHQKQIAHGNLSTLNISISKQSNSPTLKDFWEIKEKKRPEFKEDVQSLFKVCAKIISPHKIKTSNDFLTHGHTLNMAENRFLRNAATFGTSVSWYLGDLYILGRHEYCIICFGNHFSDSVITCSDSHAVCKGCFNLMIRNYVSLSYFDWLNNNEGKVGCPFVSNSRCNHFYEEQVILKFLSRPAAEMFLKFQEKCKAEHLEMKEKITEKQKISTTFEEKVENVVHQVEEMLNLKCPRCHKAFIDFSGCTHLTCSLCRCQFCAICLGVYFNNDYQHTNNCSLNENFMIAQKKRASLNIEQQMNAIGSEKIKNEVKKRISPLLKELNLGIKQFRKKIRIK
jgi:hypothetical protein